MAGKFIRGALIEFTSAFLVPVPNVIVFQFNPETIQHTWSQPASAGDRNNPLAVQGMPSESFSFTLSMDANDQIAAGDPIAIASGIYSRLAALEMLLYPTAPGGGVAGLVGQVSASISAGSASIGGALSGGGAKAQVPVSQVPMVLFIWGPGRIVPVRVKGLTTTEKIYDTLLNPTYAEAQIQLEVLTPDVLDTVQGADVDLAKAAYAYSQGLRQGLALANLANAAQSIIGMIPA